MAFLWVQFSQSKPFKKFANYFPLPKWHFVFCVWGGGNGPSTNAYFKKKLEVSILDHGQFSGHLIFDKNNFLGGEKKLLISVNNNFVFFKKKKIFLFVEKKCFFLEIFFSKFPKKTLSIKVLFFIYLIFFEKKIFPKNICFQQKEKFCLQKKQNSCLSG